MIRVGLSILYHLSLCSLQATVTYFLLLDSLRSKTKGYLQDDYSTGQTAGADARGQSTNKKGDAAALPPASSPLASTPAALVQRIAGERRWQAGLQVRGGLGTVRIKAVKQCCV